jgi:hypothetical protein
VIACLYSSWCVISVVCYEFHPSRCVHHDLYCRFNHEFAKFPEFTMVGFVDAPRLNKSTGVHFKRLQVKAKSYKCSGQAWSFGAWARGRPDFEILKF